MSFALRTALPKATRPVLARGYAVPSSSFQVKDAAGIKVASSTSGLPTSSLSVVVKAGSRYEPAPGVAHVLKDSLFKVRPSLPLSPLLPTPPSFPLLQIDLHHPDERRILTPSTHSTVDQQAQPDPVGARGRGAWWCSHRFSLEGTPRLDRRVPQGRRVRTPLSPLLSSEN